MQYFHVKTDVLMERDLAAGVVHLLDKEGSRNVLVFADEHVAQHPPSPKCFRPPGDRAERSSFGPSRRASRRPAWSTSWPGSTGGRGLDMFVAIGGGSVLDLAKAVSALIENEGVIEDYQGTGRQLTAGVKKICIPTTGRDRLRDFGRGRPHQHPVGLQARRGGSGRGAHLRAALRGAGRLAPGGPDGRLRYGRHRARGGILRLPQGQRADAGSSPARRSCASTRRLPKVAEEPGNLQYREEMLLGSCLAGYAIDNASTGAAHGMSYGPGIHFHVPHGFAVAIFSPTRWR